MNIIEGHLNASGLKVVIILSRFNEFIGNKLLEGALDCLRRHNCHEDSIDVIKVPGAFEIPLAADKAAAGKKYNAIICLGAVIRGATPHFNYVAENAAAGISRVAEKHGIPVAFGVLTTDTIEQAIERSGSKSGNKGWDAALTVIEMADLLKKMR
jgi:6,7-dimethyl-8-ribityllumazine synthase